MAEKFIGLGDTDRDGIQGLDAVSGATYSSNGIKEAVMNALGLEEEETSGNVPAQVPEAGTYQVTVAVRSDVVDHSLVQTDTAQAVLQVDESGQMKLSYTMVSGTDQEPMYILGVNGYYVNNDRAGALSMDGVDYNTTSSGDYTVVTDVTYPLSGLSQYYYTNTYLYVPAMSNLNGEISGIYFENGHFSVDTIVTVYWDTLTKQGNDSSMEITANVAENISSPSYGVSVPSSIAMGGLSTQQDNIKPYEIKISAENKEGLVTVTAPDQGNLENAGEKTLRFYNDFGTRIFNASDGSVSTATEAARANTLNAVGTDGSSNIETDTGDTEGGTPLYGNITITAEDVSNAVPGNYTGTTTFTISYSENGEDPDNPGGENPDNPGGEDPENPGGEDPDNPGGEDPDNPGGEEPDNPGSEDPGQDQGMEAGIYTVDVALWHATNNTLSMGNAALDPQGVIVVDEDGNMSLQLTFQSLNISGIEGYLYRLKKVDMSTVVYNQYNYPSSYEAEDAEILETFEGIYDSFNDPDSASYDANTGGNEYPRVISIPIEQDEDMNYVEIYVPVMESIGAGQGTQLARLHIDWDSVEKVSEDPGTEDPGTDDPGTEDPGTEDPGTEDPGTDDPNEEDPDDSAPLDIRNLADGVYSLTGRMVKVDKTTLSMSDNAINHTIKLTVTDGKYYLTLDFRGLTIGDRLGYLSELKYYLTGYTLDEYGNPVGDLGDVTVDSYQTNEDGSRISDQYGTDYPDFVTFEMIPEALEDGYVPLQVFVPIMESIAAGTGTQPVFLSLDWSTIEKTSEDDPDFNNDADGDDDSNGGEDNNNGTTTPTGSSGLTGGSSLRGGSSLTGGSSLKGGSSLGSSSLGSGSSLNSGLSTASGAKTGDETNFAYVWILLLAGGVLLICAVRIRYNRRK